jgi:RNA polymerase sigma-70 factor (ECF subfamily)
MRDDNLLVNACLTGDLSAFETLIRKYQNRIARVLYLLIGNQDDVQDVAQETFIRAFRCLHTFRGSSSFSTWLHRIALNTARNWIRKSKRNRELLVSTDNWWHCNTEKPDDSLISRERVSEIHYALGQLPPLYREVIILRHFDELSYDEIADVLQVPIGTVRSRLAKARELLQHFLTKDYIT